MSAGHDRRSLFSILVLGVFVSGCSTAAPRQLENGAAAPAKFTFDRYELDTGSSERQTVLTGFLLGGATAELAVVTIDENDDRRLRIYAFGDDTWAPKLDTKLRSEVLFVDLVNIGGRDRLVTYEPGRLNWFDPDLAKERKLVAVTSNFTPPRKDEIPHVEVSRDVNGDERDDLVVPDADGFWVLVQLGDGTFADPVKIGPPTDMSGILGADGYQYDPWSQSRIYEIDYNRDGLLDLAFWNEDHFEVHLHDKRGLFAPVARTFKTEVAFDTDKIYSLATGAMAGRALHSLSDLNGDGVGDLVVFSLERKRIYSKQSAYEVHFGAPSADGGTSFNPEVGATFRSKGRVQLGMDRHYVGRDGRALLMFTTIEVDFLRASLWKNLKGMMGDDIWLDLEFYQKKPGPFAGKPNATRRIALDGAPSSREPGSVPLDIALRGATHESRKTQKIWPRAFNSNFLIGDVTGDGRPDLLIESTFRGLKVFVGTPGPGLFASQPQSVAVVVPNDEEYTWLVDLNKDGKQDIFMHDPFPSRDVHGGPIMPPGTEPHRVTILIAR